MTTAQGEAKLLANFDRHGPKKKVRPQSMTERNSSRHVLMNENGQIYLQEQGYVNFEKFVENDKI